MIELAILESVKLLASKVLELDIHLLWKEQKIEEDFVKALLKVGFDLLEQDKSKASEIKPALFDLLQKSMAKYGGELKYMQSANI